MNRKKKAIIFSILFIVITSVYMAINMFNKTAVNIAEVTPDLSLESKNLLDDFLSDENQANTKYLEKIVQVTGKISELDSAKGNGIVVLSGEDSMGTVICHLSPEENKKWDSLKKDQKITIKGVCTGYLMDVILVKCVLVN